MAIAIDGHSSVGTNLSSFAALKITTANTYDILVLGISADSSVTVSSVSDAAGLTWAKRKSITFNTTFDLETWWARSSAALSSSTITIKFSSGTPNSAIDVFGVSGANYTNPFDVNATLPATNSGSLSVPTISSISTSNANNLVFGFVSAASNTVQTAGATYSLIDTQADGVIVMCAGEQKTVTATISGSAIAFGTSETGSWGMIADAMQQDPSLLFPYPTRGIDVPLPKREVVGYHVG